MADKNLYDLLAEHPWIREILDNTETWSQQGAANEINSRLEGAYTSRSAVKRYRSKNVGKSDQGYTESPIAKSEKKFAWPNTLDTDYPEVGSGSVETDGDSGLISYTTAQRIESTEDWAHVFEVFNLDPEKYSIIDNTVRCKTWQQSKGREDGGRDIIQLYSYGARFQKRVDSELDDVDINAIVERMWQVGSTPPEPTENSDPCTFVVCWADLQLGKNEGGGVAATSARFLKALDDTEKRILDLKRNGRNITKIVIANMGDPIEGCDQNYAQQTFTVELNMRDQLVLALNLFTLGISRLANLAEKIEFVSVLCNHGEWNRKSGKSITDDADNAGGFLADVLQMIFDRREDSDRFTWVIPKDEMIVAHRISGVQVAFTHGHKMPQSSDNIKAENGWLQNQSIKILRDTGYEPRLWVTAHRHHGMVLDFGAWWRIQCSALDGGSKWFTDSSGKWATPGITTFVVGKHDVRGFSDYEIL